MKKTLILTLCLVLLSLSFSSCEWIKKLGQKEQSNVETSSTSDTIQADSQNLTYSDNTIKKESTLEELQRQIDNQKNSINNIQTQLNKIFSSQKSDSLIIALQDSVENQKSQLEELTSKLEQIDSKTGEKADKRWVYISSIITLILLAIIIWWSLRGKTGWQKRLDRHRKELEVLKTKLRSIETKTPQQDYRGRMSSSTNDINSKIYDINSKIHALESDINKLKAEKGQTSRIPNQHNSRPSVFYMPRTQRAYFEASNAKDSATDETYFQFTRSGNTAEFIFYDKDNVQKVTASFEQANETIRKVCDIEASPIKNPTRCVTTHPGKAKLENGKWTVIEKAKIKYE